MCLILVFLEPDFVAEDSSSVLVGLFYFRFRKSGKMEDYPKLPEKRQGPCQPFQAMLPPLVVPDPHPPYLQPLLAQ